MWHASHSGQLGGPGVRENNLNNIPQTEPKTIRPNIHTLDQFRPVSGPYLPHLPCPGIPSGFPRPDACLLPNSHNFRMPPSYFPHLAPGVLQQANQTPEAIQTDPAQIRELQSTEVAVLSHSMLVSKEQQGPFVMNTAQLTFPTNHDTVSSQDENQHNFHSHGFYTNIQQQPNAWRSSSTEPTGCHQSRPMQTSQDSSRIAMNGFSDMRQSNDLDKEFQPGTEQVSFQYISGIEKTSKVSQLQTASHVNHPSFSVTSRWKADEDWIKYWLSKIHKQPIKKNKEDNNGMVIYQAQWDMHQMLRLLSQLCQQNHILQTLGEDVSKWKEEVQKVETLKRELDLLWKKFENPGTITALKKKVEQRTANRKRLRNRKKARYAEHQMVLEERSKRDQEISQWQMAIMHQDLEKKQEAELKATADVTLAEVRRKTIEVTRTLDLLHALQKLKKIRKEKTERHGVTNIDLSAYNQKFEQKIKHVLDMIKRQKHVYEAEEKTLKVMLETVEEETKEKEREQKRIAEAKRQKEEKTAKQEGLFGKEERLSADDSLLPYRLYYQQADHNLEAFIQIRHEWDMYEVPEQIPGASCIPESWVMPSLPIDETWQEFVKKKE